MTSKSPPKPVKPKVGTAPPKPSGKISTPADTGKGLVNASRGLIKDHVLKTKPLKDVDKADENKAFISVLWEHIAKQIKAKTKIPAQPAEELDKEAQARLEQDISVATAYREEVLEEVKTSFDELFIEVQKLYDPLYKPPPKSE